MPQCGGDSAGAARVNGAGHEALPQRHVPSRLMRLSIKCDVPTKLNCPLPHGFCVMELGVFPSRTHGIKGMPWQPLSYASAAALSSALPSGGTAPTCSKKPWASQTSHASTNLPPAIRPMMIPLVVTCLPVGATPMNSP